MNKSELILSIEEKSGLSTGLQEGSRSSPRDHNRGACKWK